MIREKQTMKFTQLISSAIFKARNLLPIQN